MELTCICFNDSEKPVHLDNEDWIKVGHTYIVIGLKVGTGDKIGIKLKNFKENLYFSIERFYFNSLNVSELIHRLENSPVQGLKLGTVINQQIYVAESMEAMIPYIKTDDNRSIADL